MLFPSGRVIAVRFVIGIAKTNIEVLPIYEYVKRISTRYLTNSEDIDISIAITEEDIEEEQKRAGVTISRGYQESVAVYRKIAEAMLSRNTFLMHGSVVAIGQKAFMITAPSGVGKTTRANLWLKTIPDSHILNGDKPLIKLADGKAYACGTPWCGKENQGRNEILPLKAIFFLERAEKNSVQELSFSEAFIPLLKQTYRPESAEKMKKTLQLLGELKGKVRFFKFQSNLEEEAVRMAYEAATSES